jgi:hypothetical protein
LLAALAIVTLVGCQASRDPSFSPDPVFPVGAISGTVSHQVLALDHVASALAGRRAIVNCWSQHDWMLFQRWAAAHHSSASIEAEGVTFRSTHRIQLSPLECQVLAQVMARSAQQPLYTADAVTLFAHESAHASGIGAEGLAECRATRTEPRAAQLLGISKSLALRLQHIYRGTAYPVEDPRYRTPSCSAGLPGVVVPDTLGRETSVRPLRRIATTVARLLHTWSDAGGAISFYPLSRCDPVPNRAEELARFSEAFFGPYGEQAVYTGATLRTAQDFARALSRYKTLPRCELEARRAYIHLFHSTDTVSLGHIPKSIAHLSPQVRAHRLIRTHQGGKFVLDSIDLLDPAKRTIVEVFFFGPLRQVSAALELDVTKAALRVSRGMG